LPRNRGTGHIRITATGKAAKVLREGGLIALFWNRTQWQLMPLTPAIDEVYRQHGLQPDSGPNDVTGHDPWPRDELEELPTFTDVEVRSYLSAQTYSTQEWCDLVASTSDHLILESAKNLALLADLKRLIDDTGRGSIGVHRRCHLYLARRTAVLG
jgi:hypothetical protein